VLLSSAVPASAVATTVLRISFSPNNKTNNKMKDTLVEGGDTALLSRHIGALSSPINNVGRRAVVALSAELVALETLIASGKFKEAQLRELWRLGDCILPMLVRLITRLGPNNQEISRFLIDALAKLSDGRPSLLNPHQAALLSIVLAIKIEDYSFHSDSVIKLGTCLGRCGLAADDSIAAAISVHAAELTDELRIGSEYKPVRLAALLTAAETCGGAASCQAVIKLLNNKHAIGPAMVVLCRLRDDSFIEVFAEDRTLELASGYVLRVLRYLLTEPRAEIEPFAVKGKSKLRALATSKQHHDIRGTALDVLFRFHAAEALQLSVELASSADDEFRARLVRAAFASDGLLEEMIVTKDGYSVADFGIGKVEVLPCVARRAAGSAMTSEHVQIARSICASGPSAATSQLFALLGRGCCCRIEDALRVDFISGSTFCRFHSLEPGQR
jgi:hypothetical protein